MVDVHFYNLHNITVGNVQGVARIAFHTWKACYYGEQGNSDCVKATTVTGGQYEPYSITIYNRDNGQQVTASAAWSIVLVAQLFGCLMILIAIFIFFGYLRLVRVGGACEYKYKYDRANLPPKKYSAAPVGGVAAPIGPVTADQATVRRLYANAQNTIPPVIPRWKCGHYRIAITFWILFSVWLSMAIILAMDLGTYISIKNRMFSFGSGGTQRIDTTIGPGLILNMVICCFLTLALILKSCDKGYGSAPTPNVAPAVCKIYDDGKTPSTWNCSLLLAQCGKECNDMQCHYWCS